MLSLIKEYKPVYFLLFCLAGFLCSTSSAQDSMSRDEAQNILDDISLLTPSYSLIKVNNTSRSLNIREFNRLISIYKKLETTSRKSDRDYRENQLVENEKASVNGILWRLVNNMQRVELEYLLQTLPPTDWIARGWIDLAYAGSNINSLREWTNIYSSTFGTIHPADVYYFLRINDAKNKDITTRIQSLCPNASSDNFLVFNGNNWCDAEGVVYSRGVVSNQFNPYVTGSRIVLLLNVDDYSGSEFGNDKESNIYNYLIGNLTNKKYVIPDRSSTDKLLGELRIQHSSITEPEIARLGRLLNARLMLRVNIQINLPHGRNVIVRLTDIETSHVYYTNQVSDSILNTFGILQVLLEDLPAA